MTSKHTPGPWSCIDEGRLDDCVHSDAGEHVEGDIICLSPILEGYEVSAENWEANARLIAAAPELLGALTAVVEAIDKGGLDDFMCCNGRECGCRAATNGDLIVHDLRALIAKATGEGA